MSQVMKALKQSEQAYQAQMPLSHPSAQAYQIQAKPTRLWLVFTLLLVPILLVLGWIFYQQSNAQPLEPVADTSVISDVTEQQASDELSHKLKNEANNQSITLAQMLPYPEFSGLRALPDKPVTKVVAAPKATVSTDESQSTAQNGGKIIKTDQVKISAQQQDDWNVDDLDLSGLSPELAEKFKSALNAPAANTASKNTTSKSTAMPQKPQGAVNLVGHEEQYRGRLPKMNFETHMYSSKPQSRWIKVNGNNVHEGEWIINKLVKLEQILPGSLIVDFDNQQLQIPALYEWAG